MWLIAPKSPKHFPLFVTCPRCFLQQRHAQSWEEVHKYVDTHLKVWAIKPNQPILPTLLPWLESSMDELTYLRNEQEEGVLLWVNLPCVGVVSAMKKDYFLQLISGLMASRSSNSVCVVLRANRASESKKKILYSILRSSILTLSNLYELVIHVCLLVIHVCFKKWPNDCW